MGSGPSTEIGGVRVFKVSPGSPAAEAGLEVFFDFILEVNGTKMEPNYQQAFAEKIKESENATATLKVYNTRAHSTREVTVMPRAWAGSGLLGATVRYDVVDPAETNGIRVLEVFPNSPACHAGLVQFQDFLLGTSQSIFHDVDELVDAVNANINKRMQVYVYNCDSETVREVILVPNNEWGGDGNIGCDIGTGLFHRIPAPRRPPGSTLPSAPRSVPAPVGVPSAPTGMPAISPTGTWAPPAGAAAATVPAQAAAGTAPAATTGIPAISPTGTWAPQAPSPPAGAAPQATPSMPGAPPSMGGAVPPPAAGTMPLTTPMGMPTGMPPTYAGSMPTSMPAVTPGMPTMQTAPQMPPVAAQMPPAAPQMPPAAPQMPPAAPQMPQGMPTIPAAMPGSMPAIPTGNWNPAMMQSTGGMPGQAAPYTADGMAQLQAQISRLGADSDQAPVKQVAGVKWPPVPQQQNVGAPELTTPVVDTSSAAPVL